MWQDSKNYGFDAIVESSLRLYTDSYILGFFLLLLFAVKLLTLNSTLSLRQLIVLGLMPLLGSLPLFMVLAYFSATIALTVLVVLLMPMTVLLMNLSLLSYKRNIMLFPPAKGSLAAIGSKSLAALILCLGFLYLLIQPADKSCQWFFIDDLLWHILGTVAWFVARFSYVKIKNLKEVNLYPVDAVIICAAFIEWLVNDRFIRMLNMASPTCF